MTANVVAGSAHRLIKGRKKGTLRLFSKEGASDPSLAPRLIIEYAVTG